MIPELNEDDLNLLLGAVGMALNLVHPDDTGSRNRLVALQDKLMVMRDGAKRRRE